MYISFTNASHHAVQVQIIQCCPCTRLLITKLKTCSPCLYLNDRVFLSRNYRLIVAQRKSDVFKTNMLV